MRYKCLIDYTYPGASGNVYVYCEESELELLKNSLEFRIQLAKKYNPNLQGKNVTGAYFVDAKKA